MQGIRGRKLRLRMESEEREMMLEFIKKHIEK